MSFSWLAGATAAALLLAGCPGVEPADTSQCLVEACPGGVNCQVKDDWCYIGNQCVPENDNPFEDKCVICSPAVDQTQFVRKCAGDEQCIPETGECVPLNTPDADATSGPDADADAVVEPDDGPDAAGDTQQDADAATDAVVDIPTDAPGDAAADGDADPDAATDADATVDAVADADAEVTVDADVNVPDADAMQDTSVADADADAGPGPDAVTSDADASSDADGGPNPPTGYILYPAGFTALGASPPPAGGYKLHDQRFLVTPHCSNGYCVAGGFLP